jgi:hypothetical protein
MTFYGKNYGASTPISKNWKKVHNFKTGKMVVMHRLLLLLFLRLRLRPRLPLPQHRRDAVAAMLDDYECNNKDL